jgi:hypothetical protein
MQINTQEINGYLIEDFNQYDLEEGKAQGICPLCSSDRKSQSKIKMRFLRLGNRTWHMP